MVRQGRAVRAGQHAGRQHIGLAPNAADVQAFVDEAGKEAAVRRARLRRVIGLAIVYYRQLMRALSNHPPDADDALNGTGANT